MNFEYRKWQWNEILLLHRLLQKTTECYYNLRQFGLLHFTTACYYNLRRVCYYNSRHLLLHFTTGITIHDKCNYNLRQVLQFTTLLHFTTVPSPIGAFRNTNLTTWHEQHFQRNIQTVLSKSNSCRLCTDWEHTAEWFNAKKLFRRWRNGLRIPLWY